MCGKVFVEFHIKRAKGLFYLTYGIFFLHGPLVHGNNVCVCIAHSNGCAVVKLCGYLPFLDFKEFGCKLAKCALNSHFCGFAFVAAS